MTSSEARFVDYGRVRYTVDAEPLGGGAERTGTRLYKSGSSPEDFTTEGTESHRERNMNCFGFTLWLSVPSVVNNASL